MKKLIYLLLVLLVLASCTDDKERVFINVPDNAFSFTPIMGGAVMRYESPGDPDIVGLFVRYKDVYGKDILKSGSILADTMVLSGFNEAQQNIPAKISFSLRNGSESQPVDVNFSTLDSGPICFINSVNVDPSWDGFSVAYDNPAGTTGMAHVFYLGTNPQTNEPDTVLVNSFILKEGSDKITYKLKQLRSENTIVIRTEDYRGHIVKEKVWKGVESVSPVKFDPSGFDIIYNNSLEMPQNNIGIQYLTDGDTKGTSWFQDQNLYHYYTFVSGLHGAGEDSEPMYIDLKTPKQAAEVRFYAYRDIGYSKGVFMPDWGHSSSSPLRSYFRNNYYNKMPCSVTIYGSKDNSNSREWDTKEWEEIGSFEQSPSSSLSSRWCAYCSTAAGIGTARSFSTLAAMTAADPIYLPVTFTLVGQGDGYRYLKIKFNDVFDLSYEPTSSTNRINKIVTFHELEVYGAKK